MGDVLNPDIDARIPAELHPAVLVAREAWRSMWPGMELDGSADVIVMALAHNGLMKPSGQHEAGKRNRRTR